jgi:hypothetical protein
MGEPSATKVDISAVREHSISSRRTRVHVIMCHDLDYKRRTLMDVFGYSMTVDPEVCAGIAQILAEDILRDVELLREELAGIEAFARRQLAKLEPV